MAVAYDADWLAAYEPQPLGLLPQAVPPNSPKEGRWAPAGLCSEVLGLVAYMAERAQAEADRRRIAELEERLRRCDGP